MTEPYVNALEDLPGKKVTGYSIDGNGLTIHFEGGHRLVLKPGKYAVLETPED